MNKVNANRSVRDLISNSSEIERKYSLFIGYFAFILFPLASCLNSVRLNFSSNGRIYIPNLPLNRSFSLICPYSGFITCQICLVDWTFVKSNPFSFNRERICSYTALSILGVLDRIHKYFLLG